MLVVTVMRCDYGMLVATIIRCKLWMQVMQLMESDDNNRVHDVHTKLEMVKIVSVTTRVY